MRGALGVGACAALFLHVAGASAQGPPSYRLGEIPPLIARDGQPLVIAIAADPAAVLSVSAAPTPRGRVTLGPDRLFVYTPSRDDREFTATFVSRVGTAAPVSQAVSVRPVFALPPEYSTITAERSLPDDTSDEFVTVTDQVSAGPEPFNHEPRRTRIVTVSAKRLVLGPGHGQQDLLTRIGYDAQTGTNANVKELNLYADTIEITTHVRLPQTTVRIYARQLEFRDDGEPGTAVIDTTPLPFVRKADDATASSAAADGAPGANGGTIELRAAHVDSIPNQVSVWVDVQDEFPFGRLPRRPYTEERFVTVNRLIMRGGKGQAPGNGMDAIKGGTMDVVAAAIPFDCVRHKDGRETHARGTAHPPANTVWVSLCGSTFEPASIGTKAFPKDATPARPSGVPGRGGDGGDLVSNLPLRELADQAGGESAPPGKDVAGARGGQPSPAYYAQGDRAIDQHVSPDMPAIAAPRAAEGNGAEGTFRALDTRETAWLHPFLVQAVLGYAKRVYLNGHLDAARTVLAQYAAVLDEGHLPAALESRLLAQRMEIDGLLVRIASHLDYFGHAAGWVPLLSLESNLRALDDELEAALPILYLSFVIQKRAEEQQADDAALRATAGRLNGELDAAVTQYQAASALVPSLQLQAADIDRRIDELQSRIRIREDLLRQRALAEVEARNNLPFWKQGLRILSTACKVIPVYQPVLGAIGSGLDVVTNVDTNAPLETISQLGTLSSSFSAEAFRESQHQLDQRIAQLQGRTASNVPEYFHDLTEAGRALAPALKAIRESLAARQVPQGEVEAELQRLKAQSPELADLTDEVTKLQGEQRSFGLAVTRAMNEASQLSERVTGTLASITTLDEKLAASRGTIDHAVVLVARDMEQRAFDRLLKYQYFVAKAFEYRFLAPYPAQLGLEDITRRIRAMVGDTLVAEDAFAPLVSAYRDSIRQVIEGGIDRLEARPPEKTLPLDIGLEPEELEELNARNEVTIDLGRKLGLLPEEEDRRIASLAVLTGPRGRVSDGVGVTTEGAIPATANLRLIIEHFGESVITRDGRQFAFHFGNSRGERPFTWGAAFDVAGGRLSQETLSIAGLSLLRQLVNPAASEEEGFQWFVQPGADGLIRVRRVSTPPDLRARITKLRLEVTVAFYRIGTSEVTLSVRAPGGEGATIEVDRSDTVGRRDGRGEFQRVYQAGTLVVLRAPPTFGTRAFRGWFDERGTAIGTDLTLSLTMTASRIVQARYEP